MALFTAQPGALLHVWTMCGALFWYCPSGHAPQTTFWVVEHTASSFSPRPHVPHVLHASLAAAFCHCPDPHCVQSAWPVAPLAQPAGHHLQAVWPLASWYDALGHSAQFEPP